MANSIDYRRQFCTLEEECEKANKDNITIIKF